MPMSRNELSKEEIYAEIKSRIARKQREAELRSFRGRRRGLLEALRRFHQSVGDLLGRPLVLVVAGVLAVLFGGLSLFLAMGASLASEPARTEPGGSALSFPDPEGPRSHESGSMNAVEMAPPAARSADSNGQGTVSREVTAPASDLFMVRVGTFRDPGNAERLTEALEEHSSPVRNQLGDNGLYTVTLGPFSRSAEAEIAANTIHINTGLVPQVFRLEVR
jgi:hypothetical protein